MKEDGDSSPSRARISAQRQAVFYVIIAANVLLFSVLGGALLTRYLLPLYPLVLLLCVNTFRRRFASGLLWSPSPLRHSSRGSSSILPIVLRPKTISNTPRHPSASGGNRRIGHALAGRNGSDGLAGERRAQQAGTGLRHATHAGGDPSQFFRARNSEGRRRTPELVRGAGLFHEVRFAAPVARLTALE